jgi:uncharacterized membrane protein YdbT with pleckstrin-like domain
MPVIACPDCGRDVSTIAAACPHCGRPSPAGTAPVAASAVTHIAEETLWRGRPAWTVLLGRLIGIVLIMVALQVVVRFAATSSSDLETSTSVVRYGWLATVAILLMGGIYFAVALLRLRSTLYTVTNQRVMIESGLLSKSLGEIDLRYVDDTQFVQTVVQRMLSIGDVTIVSSDKTSPVYVLRGIHDPRTVRELIRSNAYQVSQRQIFTRAT